MTALYRVATFAESWTLSKMFFSECLNILSVCHSVNHLFVECFVLLSAALDNPDLCRVSGIWLSRNVLALDKEHISSSGCKLDTISYSQSVLGNRD
jgi:hypothetical protein